MYATIHPIQFVQIEVLRGEFPYPNFNNLCIFDQLQQVVCGDPLCLVPSDQYSSRTVQFVNLW